MKNGIKLFLPLVACCILFSCVNIDKYNELVQVKDYLEEENKRLLSEEGENRDLLAQNRKSQVELEKAKAEVVALEANFSSLNRNYQDLANRYNALIADNRNIGSGSATDKQYWEENLAKKQLELENKDREIQTLRYTLNQKDKRVQELLQMLRAKEGGN